MKVRWGSQIIDATLVQKVDGALLVRRKGGLDMQLLRIRSEDIVSSEEATMDSVSRVMDKLARAAKVVGSVTGKLETRADAMIAREAKIDAKTEDAFAPHEALLDMHEKGLQQVEDSLKLLSNAPLAGTTGSPDPAAAVEAPPTPPKG